MFKFKDELYLKNKQNHTKMSEGEVLSSFTSRLEKTNNEQYTLSQRPFVTIQ